MLINRLYNPIIVFRNIDLENPLVFQSFNMLNWRTATALDSHVSQYQCEWIVIINVSSNNNQHENESRANGHCHFVNDDSFSFLGTYPIFNSEDYLNIETSAIFIEVPFF